MGSTLIVRDARIDGDFYNIALRWRTSSQSFEIIRIDER